MSVFTESSDQSDTPVDQSQDQTSDWVTKVAQEKGEKFRDPNELAKGYAHAQDHIANLTRQIEEMREDLGKQDYMKEVLDRIGTQKAQPSGEEGQPKTSSTNDEGHKPEVSVDQIKELITQTLTEQEAKNTADQNLRETDRQLEQAFGTEAKAKVQERAAQLGMSNERMKQLAEESPSAFMALMGEAPRKETNHTSRSQVNTAGGFDQASNRKDWNYYQKLRRENAKLYYSPRVQNEMLAEREKQGESAFYNR